MALLIITIAVAKRILKATHNPSIKETTAKIKKTQVLLLLLVTPTKNNNTLLRANINMIRRKVLTLIHTIIRKRNKGISPMNPQVKMSFQSSTTIDLTKRAA